MTTSAPHTTVTCKTCGHLSCHGNYAAGGINATSQTGTTKMIKVCSRCRQPLK